MGDTVVNEVIVMVGPSMKSKGGIASVACTYEAAGLFSNWPVLYLNSHVEGSKVQKLLAALSALKTFVILLLFGRVKVLHIHVARGTSFWRKSLFILLAYAARCPVFIHLHSGGFPEFYWRKCGLIQKRLVRFVLDHADCLIVLSSQWWALLDGITKNKRIVKIPNFIIDDQNEPPACKRETNSVLFLGRLSEEKGFFDLLQAAAIVAQHIPGFRLYCGGEGDVNAVMLRVSELGIADNVELLGWVEEAQRHGLLCRVAAFVLPSYVEGLPMAVIEAMSKGTPVVASNVGGVPDVIEDGKDGLLVRAGDVAGIAQALITLLEDSTARVRLGAAGRQKVARQFSASCVLPVLERLYSEYGVLPKRGHDHRLDLQNHQMNSES
jgi:glycosyltransferase involved in cell wall biosynthesis